jgi:CRP/FNR family cyclic AMP-dependent transcriptional regulator
VITPVGDSALLSIRGPGEAFGELALVASGGERSATVTALEPAETRSVFRDDFANLRRQHPGIDGVLVSLLADEVRRLSQHLVEAYYADAETRIRRRLRDVAELYAGTGDGPTVVPLNQEDLAGLAGTSRATANRVLRDEEQRGTLELGRGRITIHDLPALRHRAR